ncbi:NAD(P)/FAD-dependent oxidoreductase [Primorskyibacter marinus]|uniref:NAD(P)/FAD-dependent oxidoreductase n=1 Tax=Primorskyibacter marinus TaxID=1977320 RepID=UPI0022B80287|nr:FAD-binding oxidoreductase [Primorskyibacter marinus]
MRHIYGAYALSDEPNRLNFWARDVPETDLAAASAKGNISTDVLVIGGGYTGLNAALHLAEDAVSVCLIDARHPGWGASGRNGGFCCAGGTRAPDTVLTRRFGEGGRGARGPRRRARRHRPCGPPDEPSGHRYRPAF